jgi:hypothetical protein
VSIKEHIAHLEALSTLDQEIRLLDEQLNQDRGSLTELKSALAKFETRVSADTASIAEMSKTRADLSLELRQMTSQVEKSREKLTRARNEREQNAVTRELEELRRLQKDREEEVAKLTTLEAAAQKSKDDAEAERAKVLEQLSNTESSTTSRVQEAEAERATKLEARKHIVAKLPKALMSRYETIRGRRGTAIAVTYNGTCEACHMALPPHQFHRIIRDETMELCPSCQRILYYKPPAPKEDA